MIDISGPPMTGNSQIDERLAELDLTLHCSEEEKYPTIVKLYREQMVLADNLSRAAGWIQKGKQHQTHAVTQDCIC